VPAFGQGTRGSLKGTVKDQNGAAVNEAKVTIKNIATNDEFKGETNVQGAFDFPQLAPGRYSVTVEASGFKKAELAEGVTVEVAQPASVDISLEVGAVTDCAFKDDQRKASQRSSAADTQSS
jgi:hypothetical protein